MRRFGPCVGALRCDCNQQKMTTQTGYKKTDQVNNSPGDIKKQASFTVLHCCASVRQKAERGCTAGNQQNVPTERCTIVGEGSASRLKVQRHFQCPPLIDWFRKNSEKKNSARMITSSIFRMRLSAYIDWGECGYVLWGCASVPCFAEINTKKYSGVSRL